MGAIDNPGSEMSDLMRRVRMLETQSGADGSGFGGGDSDHTGAGSGSVQLGPGANASGYGAIAVGDSAWATGYRSAAFGWNAFASGEHSTAVGENARAEDDYTLTLGTHVTTVLVDGHLNIIGNCTVWGTFSNPSARHLKQNIIPAPRMQSVFPRLYEWEYIEGDGRRRIGPIADELLGTDAERFLTFDADGNVAGIESVALHTAQIAALLARIELLEDELRRQRG
jgi:hypothetical protein